MTNGRKNAAWILGFAAMGVPAFVIRGAGLHLDPLVTAAILGLGVVGGAFLLSWAAEVAQIDVSAALAIAVLALIAVLPEYVIEAVLAWRAGASYDPSTGVVTRDMELVAANVTGANRLLIGLGWSAVILIYWLRRRGKLDLRGHLNLEIAMLTVATLLTLIIFFTRQVHFILGLGLTGLYLVYLWFSSRQETEEPELVGPALAIGSLPAARRRLAVAGMGIYAAAVILAAAEPFVESLIDTGGKIGIDEFILIQWIAPLASEAPEIIIAVLFSLRANPVAGLSTLVSAEVNQLTLLVGSMVIVFSLSAGQALSFPLVDRQLAEFLLLTAVSMFGIMLIARRVVTWHAGVALLVLFVSHLFFTDASQRYIFAYINFGLALALILVSPRTLAYIVRPPVAPSADPPE